MAEFTGEIDGFTCTIDWNHVSASRLVWSAVVRNSVGDWCGSPSGKMSVEGMTDGQCGDQVRQIIENSIRDGIGVDRSGTA